MCGGNMCVLGFCIKIESSRTRRGGEYTKALFKCDSILARRLGVGFQHVAVEPHWGAATDD